MKFQGLVTDEGAEEQSSVGLNSLLDRPYQQQQQQQNGLSVFSNSEENGEEEESTAWTLSSLGHSRRLYGRNKDRVC